MSIPNVKVDTELQVNVVIPVQNQLGNEESYLKLITKRFLNISWPLLVSLFFH
ncbi:hypothetical protein AAHH67_28400 [Niallia circulans]